MTQPTQAQIEYLKAEIERLRKLLKMSSDAGFDMAKDIATKLEAKIEATAAAQVGGCKTCGGRGYIVYDAEWEPYAVQCPDCKPAAQVGEPTPFKGATIGELERELEFIEAATIERCAQVAEAAIVNCEYNCRDEIVAAIRKLKDEP